MTNFKTWVSIAAVTLCSLVAGQAQYKFEFTFSGVSWTTNTSGKFVSKGVSNKTLIADFIKSTGATNRAKDLILAYHYGADERGDVIEILDRRTGATVWPLFDFFFGTAFDRQAMHSADGKDIKRIDYVYSHQLDHSAGSALNSIHFSTDKKGNTNILFSGQMDYVELPNNLHTTLLIVNGKFKTGKTLFFNNTP